MLSEIDQLVCQIVHTVAQVYIYIGHSTRGHVQGWNRSTVLSSVYHMYICTNIEIQWKMSEPNPE